MLLISLLISFLASSAIAGDHRTLWLQKGCELTGPSGEERFFPGAMCFFLNDGTFVSAGPEMMRLFSSSRKILWEIPGSFHHQVTISTDRKRFLTLASEHVKTPQGKQREDVFLVVDRQSGKVLSRAVARDFLAQLNLPGKRMPLRGPDNDYELTHFNSIYEVPKNKSQKQIPWLAPGNIIVNGLDVGIFVLTPDLKKVLHHMKLDSVSQQHSVHDVQVTPQGEILYYNNHVKDARSAVPYSALEKFHPVTEKKVFEFTASPKGMFYSPRGGGVQELGDLLVFNHPVAGAYVYSKKKKALVDSYPIMKNGDTGLQMIQEVKLIAPQNFFEKIN